LVRIRARTRPPEGALASATTAQVAKVVLGRYAAKNF